MCGLIPSQPDFCKRRNYIDNYYNGWKLADSQTDVGSASSKESRHSSRTDSRCAKSTKIYTVGGGGPIPVQCPARAPPTKTGNQASSRAQDFIPPKHHYNQERPTVVFLLMTLQDFKTMYK